MFQILDFSRLVKMTNIDKIKKELINSIASNKEEQSNTIIDKLTELNKSKLDNPCRKCGGTLYRSYMLFGGPYSGIVRCDGCDYRRSVMGYLGEEIVKVEPMPKGK